MSPRRLSIAMLTVCGLCVWGFANSGDEPARARSADPECRETEEDEGGNRDEAAARYRANQSRHWRQVAIGSSTKH